MATLPTAAKSEIFSRRALIGLNRFGELMFPRTDEFPSFSELGCICHVDGVLKYAPKDDVQLLGMVLGILSFCPDFILRGLIWLIANSERFPDFIASQLRLMDMGFRSVVVTLYFSGKAAPGYPAGKTPVDLIGYQINAIRP